jgi:hypothetical protein
LIKEKFPKAKLTILSDNELRNNLIAKFLAKNDTKDTNDKSEKPEINRKRTYSLAARIVEG